MSGGDFIILLNLFSGIVSINLMLMEDFDKKNMHWVLLYFIMGIICLFNVVSYL